MQEQPPRQAPVALAALQPERAAGSRAPLPVVQAPGPLERSLLALPARPDRVALGDLADLARADLARADLAGGPPAPCQAGPAFPTKYCGCMSKVSGVLVTTFSVTRTYLIRKVPQNGST